MPSPASLMSTAASASPMGSSMPSYGLAMRFQVTVDRDRLNLGAWSVCKGLQVKLEAAERLVSGGDYSTGYILPKQVTYTNITLERAVHPDHSVTVKQWLEEVVRKWMNYDGSTDPYPGVTAKIALLGAQGTEVMSWNLMGVYPVSWTGPSLDASTSKIAIEALELAHQGFLSTGSNSRVGSR